MVHNLTFANVLKNINFKIFYNVDFKDTSLASFDAYFYEFIQKLPRPNQKKALGQSILVPKQPLMLYFKDNIQRN